MKLPGTGGPPSVHLIPRWRSSPVYGQASPTAQGVETGLFGKISRFPSRPQRFPSANRGVVARKMPENRRFCNYSPPSESKRDSDLIRTIRHQITRRGRYSTRYHDMHGYYNRVGVGSSDIAPGTACNAGRDASRKTGEAIGGVSRPSASPFGRASSPGRSGAWRRSGRRACCAVRRRGCGRDRDGCPPISRT